MSEPLGRSLEHVLVAMILADDEIDPDEVATAERAYAACMPTPMPEGELERRAAELRFAGKTAAMVLDQVSRDLTADQRDAVFTAAFHVASADGFVLEEEDTMLQSIATALGMEPSRARTLVNALMG